jgi:hypothetical protein
LGSLVGDSAIRCGVRRTADRMTSVLRLPRLGGLLIVRRTGSGSSCSGGACAGKRNNRARRRPSMHKAFIPFRHRSLTRQTSSGSTWKRQRPFQDIRASSLLRACHHSPLHGIDSGGASSHAGKQSEATQLMPCSQSPLVPMISFELMLPTHLSLKRACSCSHSQECAIFTSRRVAGNSTW